MEITLSDPLLSIKENTEENLGYQPGACNNSGFFLAFPKTLIAKFRDAGSINLQAMEVMSFTTHTFYSKPLLITLNTEKSQDFHPAP